MLGCNESTSSISANLGNSGESTRSSNEEETNWPLHTSRGETLHLLPAAGWGAVSLIRQLREREHCWAFRPSTHFSRKLANTCTTPKSAPVKVTEPLQKSCFLHRTLTLADSIHAHAARTILSRDRTEDDKIFCTALPIHLRVQSMV